MRTVLAILAWSTALAQEFEVASVKKAVPPSPNGPVIFSGMRGGPGSSDPTHINWPNVTLVPVLLTAYDVKSYQIEGPDWLLTERYDLSVVIPEGATKEQVAVMWRNLLASRFGMKVRKIQKEFSVDELQIGPKGHKLKENSEPVPEPGTAPPVALRPGADGKINLSVPAMVITGRSSPTGFIAQGIARAQPISVLVNTLSSQLGHPVLDKTGLTSRYDFSFEFSPMDQPPTSPGTPPTVELGLDLAGAVQEQLGFRLVKGKGMLDVIVVDNANKTPTEN